MAKIFLLIAIAAIVIALAAIVIFAYLMNGKNQEIKYSQNLCVNAQPGSNAVSIAINSGISCFRDDVYLNDSSFSGFVSNVTQEGGSITGIIDYDTLGVVIRNGTCASMCNWTLEQWNTTVTKAVEEYPSSLLSLLFCPLLSLKAPVSL